MTPRLLVDLIGELPAESRTKTAIRDGMDPHALAEMVKQRGKPQGWGVYGPMHELVIELGERLDMILYAIGRTAGGKPPVPARWRRPGVLGQYELNELAFKDSWMLVDQLEAERAERAERRRAESARKPP